jgi:heme/copper-type cytochrome/quinol oxidase subunit 3
MAGKQNHPYHMVEQSPWPLLASLAIFFLIIGVITTVREIAVIKDIFLYSGIGLLLFTLGGWWRDVIIEAKTEHTSVARIGFRYGMLLFIASEVMFFVAFFWAYFNAAVMPTEAMGNVWPPKGIATLEVWDLPYFNTLLLLLSGTTVTWAHEAMVEGNLAEMKKMTAITILLGMIFLGVQAFEYSHATFAFTGGIYPSTFYMATGFHGLHVFVGVVFLSVCWFRAKAGHFKKGDHFGFDAAAWYWHFVDVVWLFLFIAVYWWGAGAA